MSRVQPRDYRRIDAADCRRRLNRADAGCAMFFSSRSRPFVPARPVSVPLREPVVVGVLRRRRGNGGRGKTWAEGGRAAAGERGRAQTTCCASRRPRDANIHPPVVGPPPPTRESTRRESVDSEPLRWRRHRRRRCHQPPTRRRYTTTGAAVVVAAAVATPPTSTRDAVPDKNRRVVATQQISFGLDATVTRLARGTRADQLRSFRSLAYDR